MIVKEPLNQIPNDIGCLFLPFFNKSSQSAFAYASRKFYQLSEKYFSLLCYQRYGLKPKNNARVMYYTLERMNACSNNASIMTVELNKVLSHCERFLLTLTTNAEVSFLLAHVYAFEGWKGRDMQKACDYTHQSIEQGCLFSYGMLGVWYARRLVPEQLSDNKLREKAESFFQMGKEAGDAFTICKYADCCLMNDCVIENSPEKCKLLLCYAADTLKDAAAARRLIKYYSEGHGIDLNADELTHYSSIIQQNSRTSPYNRLSP